MSATKKKKTRGTAAKSSGTKATSKKRSYLSQTDVPACTLDQALRIPRAISGNYAGGPATPLQVASVLDMSPTSSHFRQLCGASIAYGLTDGGYNAAEITLQPLGTRIIGSPEEGSDRAAEREAILKPRVIGEFLRKYDGSPLPRSDIARNVLEKWGFR